jgi:hypothetical protein
MTKFRLAHLGLVMAAIGFTAAAPLVGLTSVAYAAETVRAEVGKPLVEAQKLASAGKNKEALAKLNEADKIGNKTPIETYSIERVRASAAAAAGDNVTAAKAFESVIDSGRLSAAEKPVFTKALAGMYYRAKNYPKAIVWINRSLKDKEDPEMRELLTQTYYVSGDMAGAAKELESQSGRGASEGQLQMLANIQLKQNNKAGYVATLEKLAATYPKKSYWADLLNRVTGKPGFSGRLTLDVMRLKLVNGLMVKAGDYMEMAQLSLQAGNPAEAMKIVDAGYKAGVLGTGSDAARHQRLKDLATKNLAAAKAKAATDESEAIAAKDGDALAATGYFLVSDGQVDKGVALMTKALTLTTKYPDEIKLHTGVAQAAAGKKAPALATLKTVKGTDGAADLARYWTMQVNHPL